MMKLEDIATITAGQIMTRVSDKSELNEHSVVKVLAPGAISEGIIRDEKLGSVNLTKDVDDDKITHENDLIIKLSTPYDSAIIDKEHEGLIIPSFCAAIRLKENSQYDLKYLCALLNSKYARDLLSSMVQGTSLPMIRIKDIRLLELPSIDSATMKRLGDIYALSGQKRAILAEMIENEKMITEVLIIKSIKEANHE